MRHLVNITCIIIFVVVFVWTLQGCAAVGYTASAVGTGHTQYKFYKLEQRVETLEDKVGTD